MDKNMKLLKQMNLIKKTLKTYLKNINKMMKRGKSKFRKLKML